MANANDELIERFYAAFAAHDGAAMAACYAPDAHFSDPVFVDLYGREPGAMWTMLTARADDLDGRLLEHSADGDRRNGPLGRRLHVHPDGPEGAQRRAGGVPVRDGLIADHVDAFDFWRWARQALGPSGLLLGWTPMVRNKVRAQARPGLDKFLASNS